MNKQIKKDWRHRTRQSLIIIEIKNSRLDKQRYNILIIGLTACTAKPIAYTSDY